MKCRMVVCRAEIVSRTPNHVTCANGHRLRHVDNYGSLLPPLQPLEQGEGASIQARFEDFHRRNPWVYRALRELTADLVSRGRTKVGIGMLFEVLRWHVARTTDATDFKLNNNFRSRYARLLDVEFPGVFELRELKAA